MSNDHHLILSLQERSRTFKKLRSESPYSKSYQKFNTVIKKHYLHLCLDMEI